MKINIPHIAEYIIKTLDEEADYLDLSEHIYDERKFLKQKLRDDTLNEESFRDILTILRDYKNEYIDINGKLLEIENTLTSFYES